MTLKQLREQNKSTAADVAKVLGVAISTYYNYEQGIRRISLDRFYCSPRITIAPLKILYRHSLIAVRKTDKVIRSNIKKFANSENHGDRRFARALCS